MYNSQKKYIIYILIFIGMIMTFTPFFKFTKYFFSISLILFFFIVYLYYLLYERCFLNKPLLLFFLYLLFPIFYTLILHPFFVSDHFYYFTKATLLLTIPVISGILLGNLSAKYNINLYKIILYGVIIGYFLLYFKVVKPTYKHLVFNILFIESSFTFLMGFLALIGLLNKNYNISIFFNYFYYINF